MQLKLTILLFALTTLTACGVPDVENTEEGQARSSQALLLPNMIRNFLEQFAQNSGSIVLTSWKDGVSFADASFIKGPSNCSRGSYAIAGGTCDIYRCAAPTTAPQARSAGKVTISVDKTERVVLTPGLNSTYSSYFDLTSLFTGGEELTFRADGSRGGVSRKNFRLVAPGSITVTAPTITMNSAMTISKSQPLTFSWTLDDPAAWTKRGARVVLNVVESGGENSVECSLSPQLGQATIPAWVFSTLAVGPDAFFGISTRSIAETTLPDAVAAVAIGSGTQGGAESQTLVSITP